MAFVMPRVDVDLRPYFKGEERGHHAKSLIVLHETVSGNATGLSDITGPAGFLDREGLEIHGILDAEGHSAWCYDPTAVYDHVASNGGDVNSRSVGFELVSEIPSLIAKRQLTTREAYQEWKRRRVQLDLTARWCAYLHHELGIPLRYSRGAVPGITSHWDVSQTYHVPGGHWDCHPAHRGGHFPLLWVVYRARQIASAK